MDALVVRRLEYAETVQPAYGLHPYQRQVLRDILNELAPKVHADPFDDPRAIVHMPTGAGKTRVGAHAVCYLLNRCPDDYVAIWLAATGELCQQAADELSRAWGFLGRRDARVYRFWGESNLDLNSISGGFLVASLAKLRAAIGREPEISAALGRRVSCMVFDEAHQAVATTYQYVTEQLAAHRPALLGLTATPGRGWGLSDDDQRLGEMFRYNRVSIDSAGHGNPVRYLMSNRFLAVPRFRRIDFDCGVADSAEGSEYGNAVLEALGQDQSRNERIVAIVDEELSRSGRVIVFCPSVASSIACGDMLSAIGRRVAVITASTPGERRRQAVEDFRSQDVEPMVLLNFGVLTAGFDAPSTRCVVIARPTKSVVLYSQMAGRALRGPRSGGNRRCTIYTVVDDGLHGFGSVANAFSNWEELWS